MRSGPLSLFALGSSHDYGQRVASALGTLLNVHEERDFEDGEHKTRPLESVRGHDVAVIHSLHGDDSGSANDKLCRLLFFCGALKDAGAERVTAVTPYLCYARKDRRTKPNDPITTRYVAAMFESCGIDRVIVLEVHNVAAFENAFRLPTRHIEAAGLLAEHFEALGGTPIAAVSPDAGGAKRAEQFREALERRTGHAVGSAMMEKYRSSGVVTGDLLAGDVAGKVAIIVDDLISTGTTLRRAAAACHRAGATRIFAAAAHGLFMDGAPELLADPLIERIVVADSVPPFRVPPQQRNERLTLLDSTAAVAAAIVEDRE